MPIERVPPPPSADPHRRSAGRRAPAVLRAAAVAVPLLPILAGLAIGSGGAAGAPRAAPGALRPAPAAPSAPASGLPAGHGTIVALLERPTVMRTAPGGAILAGIRPRSDFGGPQALWVRTVRAGWLGVVSPAAGNGRLGWIPAGVVTLSRISWQISVSLATRRLTVLQSGRVLERYAVAIGRPAAPTPTGQFAVTDRLLTGDPGGPYGCCILALSARAPHTIQGWSGGDRIAIHSTPETGTIGQPVSHGCLRLTLAEGRWLIDHVPLGTPVRISAV